VSGITKGKLVGQENLKRSKKKVMTSGRAGGLKNREPLKAD
jgi:hypothetical protein